MPWWLLSIFTTAKYFGHPVIGSRLLNVLGLHVFRVVLAQGVYHVKRSLMFFLVSAEDRRRFAADGYLIKEDFLPPEVFAALARQVEEYRGPAREMVEGDSPRPGASSSPRTSIATSPPFAPCSTTGNSAG